MIEIHGKAGLFLEGQIHPELEGVEIVISEKGASSPLITVFTDDKGAYRYVPSLLRQVGLRLPGEEGYAFSAAADSHLYCLALFPAALAPCTVTWNTL